LVAASSILFVHLAHAETNVGPIVGDPYAGRYSVVATAGAGSQPDTGLAFFASNFRINVRPFLGAFIFTGLSLSSENQGERFWTAGAAMGASLDFGYLIASRVWRQRPLDTPPFTVHAGADIGLVFGRTVREVPIATGATASYVFEQLKPELVPFVEVRMPVPWTCKRGTHRLCQLYILVRGTVHTAVDIASFSRMSAMFGVSHEWGFGDGDN
jgi:hypothetical protein